MLRLNFLVTGANRGLGKEIVTQLRKQYPASEIVVTARQLKDLEFYREPPYFLQRDHFHQLDLNDTNKFTSRDFVEKMPIFTHVFHTASPYNKITLQNASLDDFDNLYTCQRNEASLLTELLKQKKLQENGVLIAAGAIVSAAVGSSQNIVSTHPWYAGLFSMYKSHLRILMAGLHQEMQQHRIIHANLGTFCDENEVNNDYLKNGLALTTQEVANQLITIALSPKKLDRYNVDIMCLAELSILNQTSHAAPEKKSVSQMNTSSNFFQEYTGPPTLTSDQNKNTENRLNLNTQKLN